MHGKTIEQVHNDLKSLFNDVLAEVSANNEDLIRVLISHPVLSDTIVVSLRKRSSMNAEIIMEHLDKVVQSNKSLNVSDQFDINVGLIKVPSGSG